MTTKWTLQDEKAWAEMCTRRSKFNYERRAPLQKFLKAYHSFNMVEIDDCEAFLINNATEIRDLLEPFDSDVRAGKPE